MAAQSPEASPGVSLARRLAPRVERFGAWLRDHQRVIRRVQWIVIAIYAALLIVPTLAPLPTRASHIWSNAVLFAQFAFWGLWWPFVLVSMILVGRSWCGIFCPEGALTEIVSARGLGRATPRWIRWRGWPFVAFACTTIYGQMVSVYQYPKPALVILGGSTAAAIAVGYLYGRDKRVWCRYLCPVNGVFALLAKLSPLHYRVDRRAWREASAAPKARRVVNCAPLVPIRVMQGAGDCHMCGRCAGFKDAVGLAARSPCAEIVEVAGRKPDPWETALIVFGLLGLAPGAFLWSSSPWFVEAKQRLAEWLVARGHVDLLEPVAPWWLLTNYPAQNDVMSPLDGALMIAYVLATAAVLGSATLACLALAARSLGPLRRDVLHHLAQSLIPMAGCGVFLGLSATTATMLKADGLRLDFLPFLRASSLAGAAIWSVWLAWSIAGFYSIRLAPRLRASSAVALATTIGASSWMLLFWIW